MLDAYFMRDRKRWDSNASGCRRYDPRRQIRRVADEGARSVSHGNNGSCLVVHTGYNTRALHRARPKQFPSSGREWSGWQR